MGKMLPPPTWGSVRQARRMRECDRTVARSWQRLPWSRRQGTGRTAWPRRPSRRGPGRASAAAPCVRRAGHAAAAATARGGGSSPRGGPRAPRPGGVTGAGAVDNREPPTPPSATLPVRGPADPDGGGSSPAPRGPWHPATQLEILHAAPAFAVIGVGLAFGLVAMRAEPRWDRLALLAGL